MPGGYNVTVAPQSRALVDVLAVAFLAIVLLSFWGYGLPNRSLLGRVGREARGQGRFQQPLVVGDE